MREQAGQVSRHRAAQPLYGAIGNCSRSIGTASGSIRQRPLSESSTSNVISLLKKM